LLRNRSSTEERPLIIYGHMSHHHRDHDANHMQSVTRHPRPSPPCNHVISHTTSTTIAIMPSVTRPHDHRNHVISHTTTPSVTRPRHQSRDHAISHATTRHPRPPLIYSGSFTKLFSSNGPHSPLFHFITTFFILQHITYERNSSIYSFHYY